MTNYYLIGLGSNIEANTNISRAHSAIAQHVEIIELSPVLINPPCGKTFHFPFHNQILLIRSPKNCVQLKAIFENIEIQLGREAKCAERKFNDRPIDIDILQQQQDLQRLLKQPLVEPYNQQIMSNWKLKSSHSENTDH